MTPQKLNLLWVFVGSLDRSLDSATWLDTSKELCKLGWQVSLITVGPVGRQFIDGVQVIKIPKPNTYLLGQLIFHARVFSYVLKHWDAIDVILFHTISSPWLLPLKVFRWIKKRRRPLLVMDTRTLEMTHEGRLSWKDRLRRFSYKFIEFSANHWADGRLAITMRMAQVVAIPQNKLWGVWPSGVDRNLFSPALKFRKWPQPGEAIHLVYIGVLNYERNLMKLSKAVEKANAEGMSFILSLVGEGTERRDLEIFSKETDGRIRILLPIPHSQVPDVLAQAHVGVLPFTNEVKFQVSSPIKLFEYMASGLPVLVTRIDCHTDVVGNGMYAFWAEGADKNSLLDTLHLIWKNADHLCEMGEEAATAAQEWTWHESAKKLKIALENGLNQSVGMPHDE